jgi:DNA primase
MKATQAARSSKLKLPITVSHPDKAYWQEEGYTKLDVTEFYDQIFQGWCPM